jgi:hypothetical protein
MIPKWQTVVTWGRFQVFEKSDRRGDLSREKIAPSLFFLQRFRPGVPVRMSGEEISELSRIEDFADRLFG